MTDPVTGPPAPFPGRPPVAPATRTPAWVIALIAALCGLAVGGLGGAAAGALITRQVQVERDFEITAALEQTSTEVQKTAAREQIERLAPSEVETRTAQENYEQSRKVFADNPEILAQLRPESFGETYFYRTHGVNPDCGPVRAIRAVTGVREVTVYMPPDGDRLEGSLFCPK